MAKTREQLHDMIRVVVHDMGDRRCIDLVESKHYLIELERMWEDVLRRARNRSWSWWLTFGAGFRAGRWQIRDSLLPRGPEMRKELARADFSERMDRFDDDFLACLWEYIAQIEGVKSDG